MVLFQFGKMFSIFFIFKYFVFDEMEDQKCMILKLFYSGILEILKGIVYISFPTGSENPDSFDVSVHV